MWRMLIRVSAISLILFIMMSMTMPPDPAETASPYSKIYITWQEFYHDLLLKGEVSSWLPISVPILYIYMPKERKIRTFIWSSWCILYFEVKLNYKTRNNQSEIYFNLIGCNYYNLLFSYYVYIFFLVVGL